MVEDFKFTIVISLFESQVFLKDSLESIMNQSLNFKENIQLIFVDNGSIDNSREIISKCQSKYPNNILILSKENEGIASSRNFSLKHIKGEFVNFLEPYDRLHNNALKEIYNFFSKHNEIDVVGLPVLICEGERIVDYKYDYDLKSNRVIDLIKEPNVHTFDFYSSFIRKDVLENYSFDTNLSNCEDSLVLYKILINNPKFGFINNIPYYFRRRHSDIRFVENIIKKEDFTEKIKRFFIPLIEEARTGDAIPNFLQHIILSELMWMVDVENLEDYLDSEEEIKEFWDYLNRVIGFLDDEFVASDTNLGNLNKSLFIYLKNKDFHIRTVPEESEVYLESNDYIINKLHKHYIRFDSIDFNNGVFSFSGGILSVCYNDNLSVVAIKKDKNGNEERYDAKFVEYPTTPRRLRNYLGIQWKFMYMFDVDIPVGEDEVCEINFKLIYNENGESITMDNSILFRNLAGISLINNYFIKHNRILLFRVKTFYSMPYSYTKLIPLEIKTLVRMVRRKERFLAKGIFYRILRFILLPFMINKDIWLFYDRPTFADDNAEQLFKYSVKKDDGSKKYFIINKDSPDFKRLKEFDSHIVPFGSFKHKFLYLFAKKIISSQITKSLIHPFIFKNNIIYNGISKFDFYFIQHGVILHDLSSWINKYSLNLRLFVTSSDLERDSIVDDNYNYSGEVVQTLGLARYDSLVDDAKKEILFIPTWRRKLDTEDQLIKSDYLASLNSFLNNKKLLNYLKEKGYKLVFRPHPQLWDFIHLFKINKEVRISEEPYQEMFRDASLMITDYSSVFFDFAYLKKPIIYYQRDEFDEFHYDEGYYNYETMGFGKVINNEEDLVNKIIEYVENDCKMEEEYKKRVEKFFKYTDKNNCKRTYEWMLNH